MCICKNYILIILLKVHIDYGANKMLNILSIKIVLACFPHQLKLNQLTKCKVTASEELKAQHLQQFVRAPTSIITSS